MIPEIGSSLVFVPSDLVYKIHIVINFTAMSTNLRNCFR